jgi:hypothetical protein
MEVFPLENFLFILFEDDLIHNRADTFRRLQEFLDVPYHALNLDTHSNEAGEPKNELIRDIVRRPNILKRIMKTILPFEKFRKGIRKNFINKNMQKATAPTLDPSVRQKLLHTYFIDDIKLTERLIGRKLDSWYSPL